MAGHEVPDAGVEAQLDRLPALAELVDESLGHVRSDDRVGGALDDEERCLGRGAAGGVRLRDRLPRFGLPYLSDAGDTRISKS